MKMTSGVRHGLAGTNASRPGPAQRLQPAASRAVRKGLPAVPAAAGRRRSRRLEYVGTGALLAAAASVVLIGCASVPTDPLRVQPLFRVQNSSADAAPGYLALARQHEGNGRAAQALDAYRKAAQSAPLDADVLNALGLALARYAQFGPAVTALRQAVALAPERAPLLNNLGYALLLDGRTEEARAIFRLTLAVDPSYEMAARNLAYVDEQRAAAAATAAPAPVAVDAPAPVAVAAPAPLAAAESTAVPPAAAADAVPQRQAASNPTPMTDSRATEAGVATAAAGATTPPTAHAASVRLDGISIEIVNGNGITGAAARMRTILREQGVEVGRLANLLPYQSPRTMVLYRPGKAEQAHAVASRMPVDAGPVPAPTGSTRADLRVLIGHDVRRSAGCASLWACAAPEGVAFAADRLAQGAAGDGQARR